MNTKAQSKEKSIVVQERDVPIRMRDGTILAADIFRPEAEEKFPALLALSPYGKEKQSLAIPPQPPEAPLYNPGIEAGDPEYLVSRGYAHIIADLRGSGKSEGEYRGWMSKQEAEDGHDLVEWVAEQPWCDGNVGMSGISYFGAIQLSVAAEQPPHLKAIMPFNAPADFYRECTHHGGVVQTFFLHLYGNSIKSNAVSVTFEDNPPKKTKQLMEAARSDPDIRMYPDICAIVENPKKIPCFFDVLVNPMDGPFYWERSAHTKYDKIKIPCYFSSGWWAYAHMHLRGVFQNYLGIDAPKKLMINRPVVLDRPLPREFNEETLRWYDYWLKGVDTGIMDEPPIKLFVRGVNRWRFEHEWPLKRTEWTKYHLRRWQRLLTKPEGSSGRPDCFVQQPHSETAAVSSVSYMTPPMGEDMEVTGPISLKLYASIDTDDTNWIVVLKDVFPDGSELELSRGWLKASHRAIEKSRSKPWLPYHPHTETLRVVPGEIHEYDIELSPISNVFEVSHCIKLVITSMDHAKALVSPPAVGSSHLPYHICSSTTTFHKIYHDESSPSHLLLPVIGNTEGPC